MDESIVFRVGNDEGYVWADPSHVYGRRMMTGYFDETVHRVKVNPADERPISYGQYIIVESDGNGWKIKEG